MLKLRSSIRRQAAADVAQLEHAGVEAGVDGHSLKSFLSCVCVRLCPCLVCLVSVCGVCVSLRDLANQEVSDQMFRSAQHR